jgi:hypothetical protein
MGKKITDSQKAELRGILQKAKDDGKDSAFIQSIADRYVERFGVDDTELEATKPTTQPTNLTQNITQTIDKGFGVDNVKPKVEEPPKVFAPKPTYSEEDNNQVLLNTYRASGLLPQNLSDADALKVISENKKKYNPEIVSKITEGARTLDIKRNEIANASADEILKKSAFKQQELLNADIQEKNVYNQSREAKVADIISRVKGGLQGEKSSEVISKDEVNYLINVAPKAYQSLIQEYNPTNSNNIYDVISNYNEKAKNERVANANARAEQIYKLLPSDWIDRNGGVTESTLLEKHKEFNDNYAKSISDLESQYPMQYRMQHTSDGEQPREIGRGAEYEAKLEELNNQRSQVNNVIAEANGLRFVQEKNKISGAKSNALKSPIEVGEQVFKLKDPDRYKVYVEGGKIDRGTTEEIQRLGINSLYASNDVNAAKLAFDDEKILNQNSLDLENDTYNRIGAEIYKQGSAAKYYSTYRRNIGELDEIVKQLPYPNRKMWYDKLRAIEQNQLMGTNIPMSGFMNKVGEGFATTAYETTKSLASLTNFRDNKDIANDALAGQDNKYSNVGETKKAQQVKAELEYKLKNKEQLSYQELQDYNNANELLGTKNTASKFLDGSGALVGQVLFQAVATRGLGGLATKSVGALGLLAEEAAYGASIEGNIANSIGQLGIKASTIESLSGAYLGYASSIDQAKQEAKLLMPDSETKQAIYANVVGLLNAATEHIFQDQKIFDPFKKELSGTILNIVNDLSTSRLSREALASTLKKALLASKEFGLAVVKNNQQEAVEEVATQIGTSLALSILSPSKFNNKEEFDKIISTYTQTTTDGLILGAFSGGKEYYANRVGIPLLAQLGQNEDIHAKVIQGINAQVDNNTISAVEGNEKKYIANAIRDVYKTSMPKVDEISPNLKEEDRQKYAVILANEYVVKEKIKGESDSVIKSKLEEQLKESESKREAILDKKLTTGDNYELLTIEQANEKARLEAESKGNPQAQPTVQATPQTEEEKLQSLNTDGMKPSIQDNGQIITTQPSGATTTTPTQTINGTGTYEFEGELYVQDKDGNITREDGGLFPLSKVDKIKKEGIFTPITPISNEQAQSPNIQVPSTEGTAVNGQGEVTAQPQEVLLPTGNTPQIETKPLIEVPNNKTNLAELVTNNKDIFGDFAPMPRADGTYKPLELKKAIDIVEKYNEETQISNNAITQQNTKQNGKSNQEAINAKAEGQGQNDVVGNQVGVASANTGTSTTATRTIEQIDLELETLDNSIGDNTTKDDLKTISQQQKQLKAEKQQIVDTRNAEISKPFDEKITAFENEVSSLKKDIEDEGYEGKVLDNANTQIARLNDQIKATKEEKVKALAQPISPSSENGNAQQTATAKSKEKLPISSKVGEAVTVNIGGKAISGIVESDEGGKLTLSSGNKIIELSNDQQYVDYASPVRLADNQDGIEVNGEVYTEVRFDISNGKEVAVLIKEDGSITINSNPQIIEELKYQSALAMLDEMSEQEAQKLKQRYESKRTTEKPTKEGTNQTDGATQQKSEEEIKLQEAIDEIGLIEQIALDDLENNDKKARLIEHENGKTYLVEKNKDGSYTATLNGRKVRQGNHLNSLIEMYKTQSKKESDELIPKLQKQVDDLKQEVLDKLYNKQKTQEDATKESNKQQEVGTESNISQREGTVQGQREEGQGKGEQRSTENKGADNSNSNQPSEGQKEVGSKTENEFDKVPVYSATREEGKAKEQQLFDILDKVPVGTKIKTEDGFKVVIENSTSKSGQRTIAIQDFTVNEDGSLLQGGIEFITTNKEGKLRVDYNPHNVGTNSKGERIVDTDILTNEIVDLSTYDIYKYDNEQGKEVKIQDKAKSESQKEVKAESNPALRDVESSEFGERKIKPKKVISTKDLKEGDNDFGNAAQVSDDGSIIVYHVTDNDNLVNSLTAGKNPKDTYNTDGTKREELGSGVYGSAVPEYWANRSANKYGFLKDLPKEKQKLLANKIKDSLNQYISKGYITPSEYEYGIKSVREYEKSGNENQLLSVSGQPYNIRFWENDYLKDLAIENNGIPNVVAIKAKGNFIEFSDAPYLTKSDVDKLIASGVDGAFVGGGFVNNPELVIFNKDAIQGYRVDKLKEIDFQNKNFKAVESLLSKEQTANGVVDEINSLNLTRVEGTNMGSKQADGTYISTEKGGNRYEGRGKTTANSVEVNVTNPKVQTVEENTALRESILQTQLDNNEISIEDLSGEALVNAYDYFKSKGIDNPTNKQVSEYIKTEGKGKVAIDDITDTKTAEVAKEITKQLKKEGYDSLYFREGNNQEGELIVFDNAKVKTTNKENGKEANNISTDGKILVQPTSVEELPRIEAEVARVEEEAKQEIANSGVKQNVLPISSIIVAPQVFQFKAQDEESGVNKNEKLKGKYDRNIGGSIGVWVDTKNELGNGAGKVYVVDGHHRMDLAKRSGMESVDVFYIDAPTAKDARVIGAKANISQGRGTAIDAAKVYRQATPEQLDNFYPRSKIGKEGEQLAKLTDNIFALVVQGKLDIQKAIAVAQVSQDKQEQFVKYIRKVESSGAIKLTQKGLMEIAKTINEGNVAKENVQIVDLFGTSESEMLLLAEQGQLNADIKESIGQDARVLSSANRNKDVLEKANNVVNTEENEKLAQESKQASAVFDIYKNRKNIADLIKKATTELSKTKSRKERQKITDNVIKEVKKEIQAELDKEFGKEQPKFATNKSVGTPTTTPQQKKEVSKIIEFFNKQFGLDVFAPFSKFTSKLKSLGYDSLKAMVDSSTTLQTRNGKEIGYTSDTEQVARERFDFSKLKKIGQGSDRTVFELGDGKVLKVAHTARGLEQNIYEGDYYLSGIVPEVFERGLNYVVVEETPRLKSSDIVPTYDIETNEENGTATAGEMIKELSSFTQSDFDNKNSKLQDVLNKYGFQDILSYDVLYGDFNAMRNWGYKNGIPMHLDGGTFGGVRMITSHKGKAPLTDPEFREIYYKSKELKKEFGDTDRFTKFLKKPNGEVLGFVDKDGKVYLNPNALTPETTFHELTHVQQQLIKIAAEQGDEKAKAVLRRWDKVVTDYKVMEQFAKDGKIKIDKATIDLSSDVYKQGENESNEAHRERITDEIWSYLTAPENANKWNLANKSSKVGNFINAVVDYFKNKLGLKGLTNKQILNSTLKQLIENTSNSLMKGEWLDIKNESITKNKNAEIAFSMKMPDGSTAKVELPKGMQIVNDEGGNYALLDENGINISGWGGYKDILQLVNDEFPIGTKSIKDATSLDLLSNVNKFTLKQLINILQTNDRNSEWSDGFNKLNNINNYSKYRVEFRKLLSDARENVKSLAEGMLKDDEIDDLFGDISGDFQGQSLFQISSEADQAEFFTNDKTPATKEKIQAKFKDAEVVQSESDLPKEVQDEIKAQKADGRIKGVYYNGRVILIADNIKVMGEAIGTYRHEMLGHKGVIERLGTKLNKFATDIVNNAKTVQLKKLEQLSQLYFGKPISELNAKEKSGLGQEYISFIAENRGKYPSTWQKIVDFVKQTLRSLGIPLNVSDKEIISLIGKVERTKNESQKINNKANNRIDFAMDKSIKQAEDIQLTYNDKGEHLAPNGKPSKLTEQQAKIVRTEAFKNWFGDWENDPKNASKVVDENGEPLVLYHGTENSFNEFDREIGNSTSGLKEFGNYFTDNKELAKVYGNSLKEVFLNIRYLPEFDAKGNTFEEGWRELKVDAGYKIANNRDAMEFIRDGKFGVEKAEGIKAKNIIDLTFYRPPTSYEKEKFIGNTYLVFDQYPNQIKLADGTNKTFSPDTSDIRFSIYQGEQDTPLTPQDEQDLEEVVDDIKSGNSTIEQYSKLLDQKSLDYIKSKLEPATKGKVPKANTGSVSDTRKDPLRTTDNGTPYSFLELIKDDKDEHKAILTTLDKDKQTISQTQDTTDDILGIQSDNFIIDSTTLGKMQEYADQDEQAIMKAIDGFPSEMKGDRDNVDLFLDALIETREQTGDTITPSNIRVIGIFNNLSATLNKQLADPNITTAQRSDIIAKIQKIDMLTRQIARSSGLVLNARRNFRNLFNAVNSVNIANLANNKILTTENETMVNDFVSSINEAFENDQLNSDNDVDINDEEEAPKPKTPKTKRSKPSKNLMSMFEGIMKIGESFKEQINKITCK